MLLQTKAVLGHKLRLLSMDLQVAVFIIVMPLVAIVFLADGYAAPRAVAGATGVDQVVPGMATLFGFTIADSVGYAVFREHGWGTWNRLRTTPLATWPLMLGTAAPFVVLGTLQVLLLHAVGYLFLDMQFTGTWAALVVLAITAATTGVALGLLLVAICPSSEQMAGLVSLLAVLLGGIGGALAPTGRMPAALEAVAHLTPQFWVVEGYKDVILGESTVVDVLPNMVAVAAFAAIFFVVAGLAFDRNAEKSL